MATWLVTLEKVIQVEAENEEQAHAEAQYTENDGELSVLFIEPIED